MNPSFWSALSIINTERAQACIFLTAETLYDYSVFRSLSKVSVTEITIMITKKSLNFAIEKHDMITEFSETILRESERGLKYKRKVVHFVSFA